MRKFSMPSIKVRNFSREVLLDASTTSNTNMAAAQSKTITIGGQTVKLDGTGATVTQASMK